MYKLYLEFQNIKTKYHTLHQPTKIPVATSNKKCILYEKIAIKFGNPHFPNYLCIAY